MPALRNPFEIAVGDEDVSRILILVKRRAGVSERLVADHDAKLVSAFGRNRGFNGVENAQLSDGDRIDREPCRAKVSTSLLDDVRPVAVEFVVAVDDITPFEDGEIQRNVAFCMLLMRENSGPTPCTAPLAPTPLP